MDNKKADAKRAEQLYGSNRVIDVSEKCSVEVIEFKGERRDIELERLRNELEEICKATEIVFELRNTSSLERYKKNIMQLIADCLRSKDE